MFRDDGVSCALIGLNWTENMWRWYARRHWPRVFEFQLLETNEAGNFVFAQIDNQNLGTPIYILPTVVVSNDELIQTIIR